MDLTQDQQGSRGVERLTNVLEMLDGRLGGALRSVEIAGSRGDERTTPKRDGARPRAVERRGLLLEALEVSLRLAGAPETHKRLDQIRNARDDRGLG
jgi:hypothetical protein